MSTAWVITCLLAATFCSEASYRHYGSDIDNSIWKLTRQTKLQCELTHEVPRFGHAVFSSLASKIDNLAFTMDMVRLPRNYSVASVESVPPAWRPGEGGFKISDLQWRKQFDGDVDETAAWVMLTELEKGNMPTLHYRDWDNQRDKVAVALSATNFRDAYDEFLMCRDNMLDYSFEDISQLDLQFEFGGAELDKPSKAMLAKVREYLKYDQDIESISVMAYSDSWGGRWHNQQVSIKRAEQVQQFFVEAGVQAERISISGFGEKRHIASNQTELGRQQNRRVVVQLIKP
jgi:outer membrane protein OmpA-like peptidoglycan-associated protein